MILLCIIMHYYDIDTYYIVHFVVTVSD